MIENRKGCIVGIDIGAGSGAKIGLFGSERVMLAESLLPVSRYGSDVGTFADMLASAVRALVAEEGFGISEVRALGVACPGFLRSDRTLLGINNLPFLNGANLEALLSARLGVSTVCVNDADAGALAVWNRERTELFYWVLGGGWGGAWVSSDGEIRYPSFDWNGDDETLHYTNEPGYAIPLDKALLHRLFELAGTSFGQFSQICIGESQLGSGSLVGPSGRADCVRAEILLSGPGRWRIFRTFAADDCSHESRLSRAEISELDKSATAGRIVDKLGSMKVDTAVRTDRLFGQILGEAALLLFEQASRDGCLHGIPIFLAGKPSRALSLFGPAAGRAMREKGIMSEMRLSIFEKEKKNANLLGAALVATGRIGGDGSR